MFQTSEKESSQISLGFVLGILYTQLFKSMIIALKYLCLWGLWRTHLCLIMLDSLTVPAVQTQTMRSRCRHTHTHTPSFSSSQRGETASRRDLRLRDGSVCVCRKPCTVPGTAIASHQEHHPNTDGTSQYSEIKKHLLKMQNDMKIPFEFSLFWA